MSKNYQTKIKENNAKGITLIALVITIIVLLILAAVSIAMLTGQNGILTKANSAKEQTTQAEAKEKAQLAVAASYGADGKINLAELNDELSKFGGTSIESLPGSTKIGNWNVQIKADGTIGEITLATGETTPVATAPNLPTGATVTESDASKGITIKDSNNNEWVWIEVPKTATVYPTAGLNITEFSDTDYTKIKADLITYATDYREGSQGQGRNWTDEWYSGCGIADSTAYTNKYNAMLKSVYTNGGFYIGKYEVGIKEDTVRSFGSEYTTEHATTGQTPVITANKIPYNWVRCSQAEGLAEELSVGGKTSSLMFGIQWDLVMKYLEVKGGKTVENLKSDSSNFGNYYNVSFDITQGKSSTDNGASWSIASNKPASNVLLTTGATNRNAILNLYDIAGNVCEWTLEKTSDSSYPCADRGGGCGYSGSGGPASYRNYVITTNSYHIVGFRATLY